MAHIELPRALEDYFAFAETTPTRGGRRFLISLPYFCSTGSGTGASTKLDRLQWWYHLSPEQERQMGEAAVATLRAQATEKFRRHIERWLQNTRQTLHGSEPIPRIDPLANTAAGTAATGASPVPAPVPAAATSAAHAAEVAVEPAPDDVMPWPSERVVNG
jgi:hypothetical protein